VSWCAAAVVVVGVIAAVVVVVVVVVDVVPCVGATTDLPKRHPALLRNLQNLIRWTFGHVNVALTPSVLAEPQKDYTTRKMFTTYLLPHLTMADQTKIVAVTGNALQYYCGVTHLYFVVPESLDLSKQEEGLVAAPWVTRNDLEDEDQVRARQVAAKLMEAFGGASILGLDELSLYRQLHCTGHVWRDIV
jgi:hypothetical protein